jgi:hypothetical protein
MCLQIWGDVSGGWGSGLMWCFGGVEFRRIEPEEGGRESRTWYIRKTE